MAFWSRLTLKKPLLGFLQPSGQILQPIAKSGFNEARNKSFSRGDMFTSNGVGFQFNARYLINKQTFLFVNPIPTFINTNGS
jgi:hypothetical protein